MGLFLCQLCYNIVQYGEKHPCFFYKEYDKVYTVDFYLNTKDYLSEYQEDTCRKLLWGTKNYLKASTSSAHYFSSLEIKDLNKCIYNVSIDQPCLQGSHDASFNAPNRNRKMDVNVGQSLDLMKDASTLAGASAIHHQSLRPGGKTHHACDFYHKQFQQKVDLVRHNRTIMGNKPYVCDKCGKRFNRKSHFDVHFRIHTGEKPFECDICGNASACNFKRHARTHMPSLSNLVLQSHDIQLHSSIESDANFSTTNFFLSERDKSSLVTQSSIQCKGNQNSRDVSLTNSLVSAPKSECNDSVESPVFYGFVPGEPSQGDLCREDDNQSNPPENAFLQNDFKLCNLKHIRQMEGENTRFKIKRKTFSKEKNKSELIRERNESYLYSKSSSLRCSERGENAAEHQKLKDYRKIRDISAEISRNGHSASSKNDTNSFALGFLPDVDAVSVKKSLGIDTQSHRPCREKYFVCKVCGKSFGTKQHLNLHNRMHTGEKLSVCQICGKRFIKQYDLSIHLLIHTGEKPFECIMCGKGFNHQSNLNRHIRSHTRKKPFVCQMCDKGFTQEINLMRHLQTHTGGKTCV